MEQTTATTSPSAPAGADSTIKLPSAFSLFEPSVKAFKVNSGTLVGLLLTPILLSIPWFIVMMFTLAGLTGLTEPDRSNGGAAGGLLVLMIVIYILLLFSYALTAAALVAASLKSVKGEHISYGAALRAGWHRFWPFVGVSLLSGLAVGVGLLLLIVPGLIFMRRYALATYYLFDRNTGVLESMRLSAEESKKAGGVWGLIGVWLLIQLLSLVPYIGWIGTLVVGALYLCATPLRYMQIGERSRQLSEE